MYMHMYISILNMYYVNTLILLLWLLVYVCCHRTVGGVCARRGTGGRGVTCVRTASGDPALECVDVSPHSNVSMVIPFP